MRTALVTLLSYALLVTGATIRRATERRPYHRIRNNFEHLVKEHYIVKLEEGHSLESHFAYLGRNFSHDSTADYRYMDILHGYTVRVSESFMHDYIRFDPGVEYVQHNSESAFLFGLYTWVFIVPKTSSFADDSSPLRSRL